MVLQSKIHKRNPDLSCYPCPSARTKYFLSRTIFKLSRTKILSRVKKSIFCFEKSFKIKFLVERTLKIYFQLEIFIMHGFWKQKIDFLTQDKIFVLDNLNIVQDKKYFVQADGRGIRYGYCTSSFFLHLNCV